MTSPVLINAKCQEDAGQAPDTSFRGKPFVTDSQTVSILRREGDDLVQIACESPEFDNRMCYTIDEIVQHLKDLETIKTMCAKWKAPQAAEMVQPYIDKMRSDMNEARAIVGGTK